MIRIVAFLVLVALVALGASWFADRPGEIVMTWQNWQASTSVIRAAFMFIAAVLLAMVLWTAIRFVMRSPDLVSLFFRERRRTRGWRAITQGLIAVGTGNLALANRSALEARKFSGEHPLTLLLAAQAAQLGGNVEKAEAEFRAMLARDETKLLGLRGLYIEAVRRDDAASARAYAQEAVLTPLMPPWAAEALIEFQSRAGDWSGALTTLQAASDARAVDKPTARRRRAVLLTAQALSIEELDPSQAGELSLEAVKLAPDLVPAAALAGRLLGVQSKLRKAGGIIEKAWAITPHPDLALAYAHLQPGDSAEDRLKRAKRLAKKKPDDDESKLSVARAALEAHRFNEARALIEPILGNPTQRACLLMAELEAAEHGDHGKAREWTIRALRAKRDPAWIADGYISQEWLPVSPRSGQLDAFVWGLPEDMPAGAILEQAETVLTVPPPVAVRETKPAELSVSRARSLKTGARAPAATPVIAEPPRPDDPGPDLDEEAQAERGF
jgi:HemY protein